MEGKLSREEFLAHVGVDDEALVFLHRKHVELVPCACGQLDCRGWAWRIDTLTRPRYLEAHARPNETR